MDIIRAKDLLETLADGINSVTGEVLPENDSCNQIEIVRALNVVLRDLNDSAKPKMELPENAEKPWTTED